ncbi:EAL domain-containing protein [Janthinobacterium sp. 17J80-10]|uniref:EAL domain-containing protein n=1 Tax=Janthinobacterium sp. 17J80-10 TaxID=2497863 RepID=UPI0010055309|nr:EAL domain-containing protein [Janthinobacterium sp. 17J80-10]QAU33669.1 EAL domain-containing protein [Janthinobacterium sp. 17J80-10]
MDKSLINRIGEETKQEFGARYVRVLRTLSACSRVVIRATDEQALLDEICRTMVTAGGYTHSWVGYALDDERMTVKPMAKVGFLENNLGIDDVSWSADRPQGQGVFGRSIRSGQPAIVRDARNSLTFMAAWSDATRIYNYNSVLGLPLVVEGRIIGAIGFYSSESDRFDTEEVALLSEVASDLAHGIAVIRMRRERDEAQALLERANHILEQRIVKRTAALMAEKERATVTLQSIADGVITTDVDGRVDYLNPVAEQLTGWSSAEAHGHLLSEIFHIVEEGSHTPLPDPVQQVLAAGIAVSPHDNAVLIGKHGKEFAIEETAAPIRDINGHVSGVVLAFHDVSRSRQIAAQLSYQATHDDLTGLVNRREFEFRLKQAVKSAAADNRQHAFIYIDLDQFKIVNDTSGHCAGDELLRTVAGLLQNKLRASDTLARLGGDEFGILLENCPPQPAAAIAESLRDTVSDFRFIWQGNSFNVSLSIGVVSFTGNDMSESDILAAADTACYLAKENGRNRVHVGHREDHDITIRQSEMQWVSRLRLALQEERLQLYCQKIVPLDAAAGSAGAHFELLLRLRDEEGRLVPPGAFLPAAERFGLMPAIDRWVISSAFANFEQLNPVAGEALEMCAINLSGASVSDPEFLDFILRELELYKIPTHKVCFEITETVAIANLTQATTLINRLRAVGCKFALDDFGSGMSSFTYLKQLPVDYLKIDGSFVKDMLTDAADAAMVEAINHIGHTMGLRTIAEFVENDAILARLKDLRVDFGQGYGIGKPVPCGHWSTIALANA